MGMDVTISKRMAQELLRVLNSDSAQRKMGIVSTFRLNAAGSRIDLRKFPWNNAPLQSEVQQLKEASQEIVESVLGARFKGKVPYQISVK